MADASVSFAVQRLGDFLIQEVISLHGVKDEVESLRRELDWMRSFLEDAEQKQDGDSRIRVWVSEIQDIAYDTEDVIEKFIFKAKGEIQTPRREMLMNCFGICTMADLYGIGKQIKALNTRVLEISRKTNTYGINNIGSGVQEGSSISTSNLRDLRLTTPYADEEDVVGFEDDAQLLQAKLFLQQPRRSVVSILGMGGLGKTTLARKLYHNNNTMFELHAWVCVSQEWKTKDLLERLIKSFKKLLTKDELEMLEKMRINDMEEYLRDLLEGCKYLVVIDDVWQIEAWQSLRRALPDNQNGSKIIITTRKESVAELSDQRTYVHKLRFLREDESWQLFCNKAFPDNSSACPADMEELGKQIMAKCGGLPLAIIVLGGLLSRKQFHEWHGVEDRIWKELKNDSSYISSLLTLSYKDLSHELKSCFLYLGLFPEDSIIDVEKLTRMWVAEEFITQEGGGLGDVEEVAENYLKELIRRSLIQVVKRNWRMVTRCRVHDLLRDLAVNKAKELNFLHILDEAALNLAPSNVAYRRMCFHSTFKSRMSFDHLHQRVRTISYNGFGSDNQIVIDLVSKFGLLRVLDLSGVRITGNEEKMTFDQAIGKLIHLRYLGLNKTGIVKLPKSIGNCRALRTLDFGIQTSELPKSIKKLKQLRHLRGGIFLGAALLFEELTNLQCLKIANSSRWFQQQKCNEFALNALGKLLNLKVLWVDLGDRSPLVSVEPLLNCKHLIELTIIGRIKNLPKEMPRCLRNLKFLSLQFSSLEQDPMPTLQMLPNLLVLELNDVGGKIKIMMCTATGFPLLEFLSHSTHRDFSIELQVEEGAMPRLRAISMDEILKCTLPERLSTLPDRKVLKWEWDGHDI